MTMQTQEKPVQAAKPTAPIDSQLINTHLGWQIFLSRVFKQGTDKGLWLHWHHPIDQGHKDAVRYGYFVGANQTLDDALYAAQQSIEAIVELESMESSWSNLQYGDRLKQY